MKRKPVKIWVVLLVGSLLAVGYLMYYWDFLRFDL